jgi:aryl-alcohol dehydrogenase-like predicted oxidoreductase
MLYRSLGDTGLKVSEIGFGAWGIGGSTPGATSYGSTSDKVSLRALEVAFDQGINFFDTSNVYGYGHSEALIGRAFTGHRPDVIIATKAGFTKYGCPPDFSGAAIVKSVEDSLRRLKTSYIDILQLHNPDPLSTLGDGDLHNHLLKLLESGKVRSLGVSVKNPKEIVRFAENKIFGLIQANLNLLDVRVVETGMMNICEQKKIGFVARTPLAFGFLTGKLSENESFARDDHRSSWPREQRNLWAQGGQKMLKICSEQSGCSLESAALRFCLSFPWVSTVIPGMLTEEEVLQNCSVSNNKYFAEELIAQIMDIHSCTSFVWKS